MSAAVLTELARRRDPLLSPGDALRAATVERADLLGLGIIERLLADPDVNEIMINGPGPVWVERAGRLQQLDETVSAAGLDLMIERMLAPLGLQLNRLHPIVDARLEGGSRVNIVASPLAVDGPVVSVRRFTDQVLPLSAFGSAAVVDLLSDLVRDRRSILVVGETSSGKTTLLNSLSAHIGSGERVVTIEDTAELRLAGGHVVRLEARPANSEGVGRVSMRELVTTALRLRPDRVVVGEVRGAEAFDLLLALTAGHAGSLCTCHAADAAAGLRRLQMLASLAGVELGHDLMRRFVFDAIDIVVHVTRKPGPPGTGSLRTIESVWAVGDGLTDDETTGTAEPGGSSGLTPLWQRPPAPAPTSGSGPHGSIGST